MDSHFPERIGVIITEIILFHRNLEICNMFNFYLVFFFLDYLFSCKLTAIRSLQYCCLMIPVKNRELLQMLLKFIVRLMDNHVISLSDELPTKEMVRKSFV